MSKKCKTLTMPFGVANCGDGQFYGNDGVAVREFLASAPPQFDFAEPSACNGKSIRYGIAGIVGGMQPAPELARRLAAVARIEVVCGPRDMIRCRQRTTAVWSRLLEGLVLPLVEVSRGRLLRRSLMSASLEFRSALAAVRCAIEVQDRLQSQAADLPEQGVGLRIDIDVGEIVDAQELWHEGVGSARASAACSRRAGEVWVTGKVLAFVADDLKLAGSAQAWDEAAVWSEEETRLYLVRRPQ